MSYLIISREFPPQDGGIANVAYELAKHFSAGGKSAHVLARNYPEGKWPGSFQDEGQRFKITRIDVPSNRWAQILALFFAGLKIIRKEKIRKIYATTWNFSAVAAALLERVTRVPYVVFCYGYDISPRALTKSDQSLMRFALKHARKILASSRYTVQMMYKNNPGLKYVEYRPLGVDARRFHPQVNAQQVKRKWGLEGKKVILTVARLFARKGHDKVIEALPKVLEKVPNAVYLIAGTGEEQKNLEKKIKQFNLQSHVVFAGFIPDQDLPAYYAACDVFAMPNREVTDPSDPWYGDFEGFGIAFIEASATGKPVVAGRSGGAPDAVIEGETGLLVDPLNPDEIAEALICLFTDSNLSNRLGKQGRLRVEKELDWPVLLKKYEASFESS